MRWRKVAHASESKIMTENHPVAWLQRWVQECRLFFQKASPVQEVWLLLWWWKRLSMFIWKEEVEGGRLQIQVTERMMDGTKLLRIEERVICISPRPWPSHVVLYVNLANWSTTPEAPFTSNTTRVVPPGLCMAGNPKKTKHEWRDYPLHLCTPIWVTVRLTHWSKLYWNKG